MFWHPKMLPPSHTHITCVCNNVWNFSCGSFTHPLYLSLADVADDEDDISDLGRAQWVVSQENIQRRRRGRGKGHRFRKRRALSRYGSGGVRSRRCGHCEGCLIEEDCAKCINCLDKPKFGGPNTKRQCCMWVKQILNSYCHVQRQAGDYVIFLHKGTMLSILKTTLNIDSTNHSASLFWGEKQNSCHLHFEPTKLNLDQVLKYLHTCILFNF